MISGLQTELNKLGGLVDGVSGICLGTGSGAGNRIAAYEEPTTSGAYTAGHCFYGLAHRLGLLLSPSVGLGQWGGTGAALPNHGSGGTSPHLLVQILRA